MKAVPELLRDLGRSPREVAATLIRGQHFGTPLDGCGCPLYFYIQVNTGYPTWVAGDFVQVKIAGEWHRYKLPPPVKQLMDKFDAGEYPELCVAFHAPENPASWT